jgi:hypothetical protein
MDFTGKSLTGLGIVAPDGFESDPDLKCGVALGERLVATLPPK